MSLASQSWRSISIHDVVAEFLLNERYKAAQILLPHSPEHMAVVDAPDIKDPRENHFRLRLLYYFRCQLMCEIPPDTQWFEVQNLGQEELSELRVAGRCGWDDPVDNNELLNVAVRRPSVLKADPATWRKPILWGHDRNGPFTILEGNNRLTAYVSDGAKQNTLSIPVQIGLSSLPCVFHLPDPPVILANDLWKKPFPPFSY
jgi:hypothetical protein